MTALFSILLAFLLGGGNIDAQKKENPNPNAQKKERPYHVGGR